MSIHIFYNLKNCQICRRKFKPKRSSDKYCSEKCAKIAQKKQKRQYYHRRKKLLKRILKEAQLELKRSGNNSHEAKEKLGSEAPSTDLRIVVDEKGQARVAGALWLEKEKKKREA